MKVNIIQTHYDPTDVGKIEEYVSELDGIICFPECFALGRSGAATLQFLNTVSDEAPDILDRIKATGKTVILPLIEKHNVMRNRFYNTTHIIHDGKVIDSYRRTIIHPMEKPFIQSGENVSVFEIDDINFGLLICFEIAFPELTRLIALKGASIIFVPASTPQEADYLWKKRLVARAIDNQLFVVGVNRCGEIENEKYIGKSMVVSPCGKILHQCGGSEEVVSLDIDLDDIVAERGKEPTFSEFEIEVYDKFIECLKVK